MTRESVLSQPALERLPNEFSSFKQYSHIRQLARIGQIAKQLNQQCVFLFQKTFSLALQALLLKDSNSLSAYVVEMLSRTKTPNPFLEIVIVPFGSLFQRADLPRQHVFISIVSRAREPEMGGKGCIRFAPPLHSQISPWRHLGVNISKLYYTHSPL